MIYNIDYSKGVQKVVAKWKKSNLTLYKKLKQVLNSIVLTPRAGIGHPEPLVGGNDVTYSRRIDAHRRIIYDIYDDTITILVIDIDSHYNDKWCRAEASLLSYMDLLQTMVCRLLSHLLPIIVSGLKSTPFHSPG